MSSTNLREESIKIISRSEYPTPPETPCSDESEAPQRKKGKLDQNISQGASSSQNNIPSGSLPLSSSPQPLSLTQQFINPTFTQNSTYSGPIDTSA
eukprot:gene408-11780_t